MPLVDLAFTGPQMWAHEAFHSRPGLPVTVNMPWGRGSGKSWFARTEGIHLAVAENFGVLRRYAPKPFTGTRIVGLCPTLKQFRDIHAAALEAELEGDWKPLGGRMNKSTLRIEWPDGSWFQPMPAASASSKAARGLRCDIAFLDESDDIPLSVYTSVIRPWFTEPWSFHKTLSCGTPRMGRHGLLYHLHALGISTDPVNDRYFSRIATWEESPEIIDRNEAEDARRTTDPATFAREWYCDFDSAEGLVYPFDEKFHIAEPPSTMHFNRYAVGVDHGWEHPGAFILIGISGYGDDAIAWVLDEDVASGRTNPEWDAIASTKYYGLRAWADPSRPDRIADLRRAGLNAQKADNAVEAGIQRVASLLFIRSEDTDKEAGLGGVNRWARLYIHPKCTHLIGEMKKYKRKPDPLNPGKYLDEVIKINDDAQDALRYAIMGEFGRITSKRTEVNDA